MATDTVIEKIEEKAKAECEKILAEGRDKAQADKQTVIDNAQSRAKQMTDAADRAAQQYARIEQQKAQLDARMVQLAAKKEELRTVHAQTAQQLMQMSDSDWRAFYTRLVLENCPGGEVTVVLGAKDAARFDGDPANFALLFDSWAKAVSQKLGTPCSICMGSTKGAKAGLLLCGALYDVDLSYQALVDKVFEEQEMQTAQRLFAD